MLQRWDFAYAEAREAILFTSADPERRKRRLAAIKENDERVDRSKRVKRE